MSIGEAPRIATAGPEPAEQGEVVVDGYPLRLDRCYDPDTDHWVLTGSDGVARIGLSGLTVDTYGSLAQLMITAVGTLVVRGEAYGSLEAAKYVGPLLAPLSGRVAAVNAAVLDDPGLVVRSPYDDGWLIELAPTRLDSEHDLLISGDLAHAWFAQAVQEYREKGLVAE